MKGWDTHCLVRHLTEDDAEQLAIVRRELEKASRKGEAIWLSAVTLAETAWVLQGYGLRKREILDVIESVTRDERFRVEGGSDVTEAVERARKKGDLPEHLSALAAKRIGITKTQTFDRPVAMFPEFEVLGVRQDSEGYG
jgi:predicted nucleic-acid-binding protein